MDIPDSDNRSNNPFDPEFAAPSEWAHLYRSNGIQVVPAFMPSESKDAWKRPLLKTWTEYQHALVPDEVFTPWYGAGGLYVSRLNMGAICGQASGNLFVIDLDTYKIPAAAAWWQGLLVVHNNGMELETVEQRTGGGGLQKLFHAPIGWVPPTCKTPIGIDIRGQGGFAMLCPSMHESGKAYEWLDGRSPDETSIMMAPPWLLEAVTALVEAHGGQAHPDAYAKRTNVRPDAGTYDGFGHQTDGREELMTKLVWGAVIDWKRDWARPGMPDDAQIRQRCAEKYLVYEGLVSAREPHPAGMSKSDQLEAEGRGTSLFWRKWLYAVRQWEGDVAAEAAKPNPGGYTDFTDEFAKPKVDPATGQPVPLILTSAEFLAGYSPPAYLVDGIIQRGYLYSLTARTGHGKTAVALYMAQAIARGVAMHGCKVLPGTVLILAGENPDDVRARFFVLGKAYGFDPAASKIRWIAGIKHLPSHMPIIREEVDKIDDLVLVLIDTAAAYFPGTETNSNSEQGAYARTLREFTFLKNKPAAIALSHPVKNAARDNLLPMGGSAFLNEVDGNLTLWSGNEGQTTLHWQGKFRGPEFNPMSFEMVEEHCDTVKDADDRLLPSVVARPLTEAEVEASREKAESRENQLMRAMYGSQAASFQKLADKLGWQKYEVQRLMKRLKEGKLVEQKRNEKYMLTDDGVEAIGGLKKGHHHD